MKNKIAFKKTTTGFAVLVQIFLSAQKKFTNIGPKEYVWKLKIGNIRKSNQIVS